MPRHKVCGEFVSAESLDLLTDLLAPSYAAILQDALRISAARLFLDGRTIHAPVNPAAASIARFDLDASLWMSAANAGVEASDRITVESVVGFGSFQVTTSAGNFESRTVINASGRWSKLNNASGSPAEKWLGLKAHFAESSPPASVDLYFFDEGYCGVQPVRLAGGGAGRINACAMIRASAASTFDQVCRLHPGLQARSKNWQSLMDPVSTSPLFFGKPQAQKNGILLAGDAAGFVDPFIGDGISLALRSGALAAQSLTPFLRGKVPLTDCIRSYQEEYAKRFAPVFRTSRSIRKMLLLPRALRGPALSLLESVPVLTRYLVSRTR